MKGAYGTLIRIHTACDNQLRKSRCQTHDFGRFALSASWQIQNGLGDTSVECLGCSWFTTNSEYVLNETVMGCLVVLRPIEELDEMTFGHVSMSFR